jgi:PAS domain S-box-containing protein
MSTAGKARTRVTGQGPKDPVARPLEEPRTASRQSQEQLQLLIEAVEDYAIYMLDPEGRVATWNIGAERVKGYKAAEIIGRHFSCFYPEEEVRLLKPQTALRIAAEKGRVEDEGWRVRKDGSRFWASALITAVRDRSGKLLGFGKVTRDVTERMQAAQSLRESELRYRTLVEAATYAIVSIGDDTLIRFANPATSHIFQYSYPELIGRSLAMLVPACPGELRGERTLEWAEKELVGVRKNGEAFPIEISIVQSLKDGAKNFICSMRDISGRKRAEQQLSESERSLRRLSLHLLRSQDEERKRIGRDLHDSLGQNLVGLKMCLDSLADSLPPQAEVSSQLADCKRMAEEAIQELRTISYLMYPPMLDELGLKAAVAWYIEGFSQRSQIATTLEVSPDFTRFSPDVELTMFRILQESLTNVHRHSGSTTAQVRFSYEAERARMEVVDQGRGMPADAFEGSGQDTPKPLGVGLRGMEERVHQLGGEFKVITGPSGTTVTVSIPAAKATPVSLAGVDASRTD